MGCGEGPDREAPYCSCRLARYWLVPRLPTFEETHCAGGDGEWRRHLREHVLAVRRLGAPQQEKARVPPMQGAAGDGASGDRDCVGQGGAPQYAPHPEPRGEDAHVLDTRRHHVQRAAHLLLAAPASDVAQSVAGADAARLFGHHAVRPAAKPLLQSSRVRPPPRLAPLGLPTDPYGQQQQEQQKQLRHLHPESCGASRAALVLAAANTQSQVTGNVLRVPERGAAAGERVGLVAAGGCARCGSAGAQTLTVRRGPSQAPPRPALPCPAPPSPLTLAITFYAAHPCHVP